MTTLFQDSASWLSSQLEGSDGRIVTYHQGPAAIIDAIAVPLEKTFEVWTDDGVNTKIQSHDWIIAASYMVEITPRPGDRICETSTGLIYEVMPIADIPCCEPHDTDGQMLVVHTKRIQ